MSSIKVVKSFGAVARNILCSLKIFTIQTFLNSNFCSIQKKQGVNVNYNLQNLLFIKRKISLVRGGRGGLGKIL